MSFPYEAKENPDVEVCVENTYTDSSKSPYAYLYQQPGRPGPKSALEKRLVLKIDLLLVPLLALIYFVTFLDRNSFGNGRLMGLQTDLHMTDQDYINCAQLFFVGYIIFMPPGNILLRWAQPPLMIGGAIVIFGTLLCGMSAAQNVAAVLATRILIGAAQAMVQGIGLYGSLWWTRTEVATRGALYFSTATLSGAFSGLIAYAISRNMTEKATGRAPWRWLWLIEGVIGIVSGITIILLLPNFPDKLKKGKTWLFTKEEIDLAIHRSSTFNTKDSKVEVKQIWVALKDPKTWAFSFTQASAGLCASTIGIFMPSFIQAFGYTNIDAQLFSVIPYAFAFVALPTVCIISDRLNMKGPFIVLGLLTASVGYLILLFVNSTAVKMVGACFLAVGVYPTVVLSVTWLGINTAGFTKRGTTWALSEMITQTFTIMGTNVYKGPPRYVEGHAVSLAFLLFAVCNCIGLWFWMRYSNKRKDRILAEYAARNEIHPHMNRSLEEEYDYHINFRYTL